MNAQLVIGWTLLAAVLVSARPASADETLPPIKPIERLLPPKGVDIGKVEREKLEARLAALTKAIKSIKDAKQVAAGLWPDVEIYPKAVRWALDFDEFYDAKKDIAKAHAALDTAQQRLDELKAAPALVEGDGGIGPSWQLNRGLIVRGYRSNIDDSVQPYGLHIPENLDLTKPVPLLVWLHGRGDKETDLHFIAARQKNKGEFAPDWCITLHPYGRGTIGFKFAGEIDVLDAIESVKKRYKIDEDRIALAGFSMGGAGAWHIGAHYADKFCVVHAGAGFVETAKYNKLTPDKYPAWYEQKLWGWYDVPCYTRNLFNVPVIAYSGENDKQKQAADLMAEAFKAEGRELRHIIGPGVEHKYEAKAKEQVLAEIKKAVEKGRDRWPREFHIQTRCPEYGDLYWASIMSMKQQWSEARLHVKVIANNRIEVRTQNVSSFVIEPPRLPLAEKIELVIDDKQFPLLPDEIVGEQLWLFLENGNWVRDAEIDTWKLAGSSGPIDSTFTLPFLFVEPTGEVADPRLRRWVAFEMNHAKERWAAVMRGKLRVKKDVDVTNADIRDYELVLWGDPSSNVLIRRYQREFGFHWDEKAIVIENKTFSSASNVPVFVRSVVRVEGDAHFRNYLVVNSGPTFSLPPAPNPALSLPVCSRRSSYALPRHPIDVIHTLSHTVGFPSLSRISFRSGAVLGSPARSSKVDTCACPCMFDWPARMNTLSGLSAADAPPAPATHARKQKPRVAERSQLSRGVMRMPRESGADQRNARASILPSGGENRAWLRAACRNVLRPASTPFSSRAPPVNCSR